MTVYTVRDTPETVARIEADLATVVSTVRESDAGLRALVLTGGFARGEGAMLDGQPQNDYDFVAVRSGGAPRRSYASMRTELEHRLGLHVDLAATPAWRLRVAPASIFWYETALRGRVLSGETGVLRRLGPRDAAGLRRDEGLRLLCNRAAGLLLATEGLFDAPTQASKALLAALDVHLLAAGEFPPSQTERWERYAAAVAQGRAPVADPDAWFQWAFVRKVDPAHAPPRQAAAAWKAARSAVLAAVPVAVRHARLRSLAAYARRDTLLDRAIYWRRSSQVPGARRLARHPTGRIRVATLRMLEASPEGHVDDAARDLLLPMAKVAQTPVQTLYALRQATLQ